MGVAFYVHYLEFAESTLLWQLEHPLGKKKYEKFFCINILNIKYLQPLNTLYAGINLENVSEQRAGISGIIFRAAIKMRVFCSTQTLKILFKSSLKAVL